MIGKKEESLRHAGSNLEVERIRGQVNEEMDPGMANFNDEIQRVAAAAGSSAIPPIQQFSQFSHIAK
jgi:hypothetical protein